MKSASWSLVTESVTMVLPGACSAAMAAASAISRLRPSSVPSASTAPARSTSVSKISPRSQPPVSTARRRLSIASLFSGFGTWLGKLPSGSRYTLAEISAPSGASTRVA